MTKSKGKSEESQGGGIITGRTPERKSMIGLVVITFIVIVAALIIFL